MAQIYGQCINDKWIYGLLPKLALNKLTQDMKPITAEPTFIVSDTFFVGTEDRQQLLDQRGMVIWFSGLSGAGKTTLANTLECGLFKMGFKSFILDGDNLRRGLCNDLGFSGDDRSENIRRAGEVAKLMMESGLIVLSAFVTPFEKDRRLLRDLLKKNLVTVFVDCPLKVCEQRDTKGLYRKARKGEVRDFTGISSPFEVPTEPDITVKTAQFSKQVLVANILDLVLPKIRLGSSNP